ncbi:hypothetical protein M405DRAFT_864678 [Rhizopogon salebrosus TDB-379]|nr:hypothetical protein M405DRAFT_864678 [Rhizopogon salebrosus TDB-379]
MSDPASKCPHPSGAVEMTAKRPRLTLRIRAGCGDPASILPRHLSRMLQAAPPLEPGRNADEAIAHPQPMRCRHPSAASWRGLIPLDKDVVTVKEPSPRSLDVFNATSHDIRLRLTADERADKGTTLVERR